MLYNKKVFLYNVTIKLQVSSALYEELYCSSEFYFKKSEY